MDILKIWAKCQKWPFGNWLFSQLLGNIAPYTGSIKATVLALDRGYAKVQLRDRRRVRNHLNSIHAVAMVNFAEMGSGLAMMSALPPNSRGILKGFSIEYLKKARGTLTAEIKIAPFANNEKQERFADIAIQNSDGETVAAAKAHWQLGPEKAGNTK